MFIDLIVTGYLKSAQHKDIWLQMSKVTHRLSNINIWLLVSNISPRVEAPRRNVDENDVWI